MDEQEKDLNITGEELERIQSAMKNEEFRKMFVEYAKEISDPENRKKYETDIAQMEAERGMDVKFINPQDGFVIKTSIKGEGGKKAFINICQSDVIGMATSSFINNKDNRQSKSGHQWSIPYSLNQPKDDTDKAGKKCIVYDVIFNPRTYEMGMEDPRFKKLIMDTSFDAIEGNWKLKLDRKNLKFPKLKFKGSKQQTIIRNPNNKGTKETGADINIGDESLPYPYKEMTVETECSQPEIKSTNTTPEYTIIHRGHLDLQNFTNARDSRATSTRPKELVVNIELPLCKSASGIDLDIFEKQLILDSSNPLYHLDISLPYPIIEDEGGATFDKSQRRLIVTLPVQASPVQPTVQHSNGLTEDDETIRSGESHINEYTEKFNGGIWDECAENAQGNGSEVNTKDHGIDEDINNTHPSMREKTIDISCPFFKLPSYSYHQDIKSVSFVLHVAHVAIETVSLGYNQNKCCISFPSSVTSPPSLSCPGFALSIQFPGDCVIETTKIDSNENNLVLVLYKEHEAFWDFVMIGANEEKLEKRLFVIEGNLRKCLEDIEDKWVGQSVVTNHKIEKIAEDQIHIELQVEEKGDEMGNILAQAETLLEDDEDGTTSGDTKSNNESVITTLLKTAGVVPGEDEEPVGDKDRGSDYNGLEEVEVIEETYEDYEGSCGLSTVPEIGNTTAGSTNAVSGDNELQKARIIKCKKNRRRRRRSTGSHESSSVSEEEGELGTGRKLRAKQARRLRKTRSLSLGSSAESHDDADGCHGNDGARCVRFNLVPEIHVFSNKSDKKKWKEIRKQNSDEFGKNGSYPPSKSALKLSNCQAGDDNDGIEKNEFKPSKSSESNLKASKANDAIQKNEFKSSKSSESSLEEDKSGIVSCKVDNNIKCDIETKPQLTNQLIFDLDD